MPAMEFIVETPLSFAEDGAIRMAGTRVTLDSVVHHYTQGASAEEIALRFPDLNLSAIHSALAYYLANRESVEEYLAEQAARGADLQARIEQEPRQQKAAALLRERLNKRPNSKA